MNFILDEVILKLAINLSPCHYFMCNSYGRYNSSFERLEVEAKNMYDYVHEALNFHESRACDLLLSQLSSQ